MIEKEIKSRLVHKHDTEENWLKATNFIPKAGELIVYDVDDKYTYPRFKIGDGINAVSNLPFNIKDFPSTDGLATEDYVNEKISTITTPDVSGQISSHNTNTNAHNDIRLLIDGLTTRLNTLVDSDDTTLD